MILERFVRRNTSEKLLRLPPGSASSPGRQQLKEKLARFAERQERGKSEGRLLTVSGELLEMIDEEVGPCDPHLRCAVRNAIVGGEVLGLASMFLGSAMPVVHAIVQEISDILEVISSAIASYSPV